LNGEPFKTLALVGECSIPVGALIFIGVKMAGQENGGMMIVLVPVSQYVPGKFVRIFSTLGTAMQLRMPFASCVSELTPLDKARDALLRNALLMHPGVTYALFLDADMLAEPAHINAMLDYAQAHPEADAVSALYFNRASFKPLAYQRLAPDDKNGTPMGEFLPKDNSPAEIDAAGLGCMLVRLGPIKEKVLPILEKEGRKRFFWFDPDGHSEDINFCLLMRRAGLKIVLLPDVVVPHYGAAATRMHHEAKEKEGKKD